MNIFLTGYRCTGKTTIAEKLSELTGKVCIDADVLLVEKAGMTVAEIVEKFGWDNFRDRETEVLKELCSGKNQIIATGGGVILREDNVSMMKKSGSVIWLKASVATIAERMAADAKTDEQRPGLTDKGVFKEIEEVLDIRIPLYENAMNFSIDTDNNSFENICNSILKTLKL